MALVVTYNIDPGLIPTFMSITLACQDGYLRAAIKIRARNDSSWSPQPSVVKIRKKLMVLLIC